MNKNKKSKTNSYSVRVRIAAALFALVAVQGLILLYSISITGVITKNNTVTYNILVNQSDNRRNEIQDTLNNKRKNITNVSLELSRKVEQILADNNVSIDMLNESHSVYNDILSLSLSELIAFTKYSPVTGVFVVFDYTPDVGNETKSSRLSMYLRDSAPGVISGNNSNLMLEYGHVDIARQEGIALDTLWTRDMSFDDEFSKEFYYKPINAALKSPADSTKPQIYGYWSPPFKLKKNDISIITYSQPLILSDGTIYGIIGFEFDTTAVGNLMKATEIPYNNGFYLLGTDTGDGLYNESVISSGAYANQFLSGPRATLDSKLIYENENNIVYELGCV